MDVLGFEQEADSHRAQFFVKITIVQDEAVPEPTELQSRDQYHCGEPHLAPRDWPFLRMEQRGKDRYYLVTVILVLCVDV